MDPDTVKFPYCTTPLIDINKLFALIGVNADELCVKLYGPAPVEVLGVIASSLSIVCNCDIPRPIYGIYSPFISNLNLLLLLLLFLKNPD